ncbi:MAG: class I SAM-dependent methyltransferase [Candidatus Wallbacteria bacterium]|nr:class I SAM-dependent methyltransferase [Candidatus Wallbacteria bacterium]
MPDPGCEDYKLRLQEDCYAQPYHYFVDLNGCSLHRYLSWGLEYWSVVKTMKEIIGELRFSTLLDAGCGDGYLLNHIACEHPDREYTGADISDRAVRFAEAFRSSPNIRFLCKNIADYEESADIVTLMEVLEHIPPRDTPDFIQSISRILKKNGLFIVSVPTQNVPLNRKHFRHFDADSLARAVGPDFAVEKTVHVFDFSSPAVRLCTSLLRNRMFVLDSTVLRRRVFRFIDRFHRVTDSSRSAHLITVFRKEV